MVSDKHPAKDVQGRHRRPSLLKKMASKNLKGVFPELKIKKGLHDSRTSVNVEKAQPSS